MSRNLGAIDSDLYLNNDGNLAFVSGIESVLQQCEQAMKLQMGEAIYSVNRGISYESAVFNRLMLDRFQAEARVLLQSIRDVEVVNSFDVSIVNDVLAYRAVIRTVYGEGVIGGL